MPSGSGFTRRSRTTSPETGMRSHGFRRKPGRASARSCCARSPFRGRSTCSPNCAPRGAPKLCDRRAGEGRRRVSRLDHLRDGPPGPGPHRLIGSPPQQVSGPAEQRSSRVMAVALVGPYRKHTQPGGQQRPRTGNCCAGPLHEGLPGGGRSAGSACAGSVVVGPRRAGEVVRFHPVPPFLSVRAGRRG